MNLTRFQGNNFLGRGHLLSLLPNVADCLQLPLEPEHILALRLFLLHPRFKILIVTIKLLLAELALLDLLLHAPIYDVCALKVDLIAIPHERVLTLLCSLFFFGFDTGSAVSFPILNFDYL